MVWGICRVAGLGACCPLYSEGRALLVLTLNQSVIHYKRNYSGERLIFVTCLFFQPLYSPIHNLQPTIRVLILELRIQGVPYVEDCVLEGGWLA